MVGTNYTQLKQVDKNNASLLEDGGYKLHTAETGRQNNASEIEDGGYKLHTAETGRQKQRILIRGRWV